MDNFKDKILDTVIIGAGPAGLSAAIYAARANMSFVVLGGRSIGGQIASAHKVDNYPGLYDIDGFELGLKLDEHARELGAVIESRNAVKIEEAREDIFKVICDDESSYLTGNIIVATGAVNRKLNVKGEEEYRGRGVSYCATCDGGFFRGKTVAVVGGGDTAVSDAIYLSNICNKVYIIHRRDSFRCAKSLEEKLYGCENVEIIWDSVVEEITGNDVCEGVHVRNVKMDMQGTIMVQGVFIAAGTVPNSGILDGLVSMDEQGYVIAGENCVTSNPHILVAGDLRRKDLKQVITAAADGANAVNSINKC